LPTWPKLSGGKGVHVVVPVKPSLSWEDGRAFIRGLATTLAAGAPGRYTVLSSLAERARQDLPRLHPEPPRGELCRVLLAPRSSGVSGLAMPVTWEDIEHGMRANAFDHTRKPIGSREIKTAARSALEGAG